MCDENRLPANNASSNPDPRTVVAAKAAQILTPQVNGRTRRFFIQSGPRLVDNDDSDEGDHAVWSFKDLKRANGDHPTYLGTRDAHTGVHQPVQHR
jgi:hypothetical protein